MAEEVSYLLSLRDQLTPKIEGAEKAANKLETSLGHVGEAVAAAFAIHKIIEFGTEILHVTAEFEGFDNIIKYSSINSGDATKNLDYINEAIVRLHLPMKEAKEQFSEMEAGMLGTGVEGEKLRSLFEGVAQASSTLHLSADQFSRSAYAIKEIGELGTLQARQLRMLAMALPGSMQIAADALGVSSHGLHEQMKKGLVTASTFLPKFAIQLQKQFGAGLTNAGNSLIAKMNDTQNEFIKLQLQMGEDLKPVYIALMSNIIDFIGVFRSIWDWGVRNKEVLKEIATYAAIAGTAFLVYKGILLGVMVATKLATFWELIQIASLYTAAGATGELGAGMTILTAIQYAWNYAITANPIGVLIVGIAALVAGVVYAYNHFEKFRATLWAVWAVIKEFAALSMEAFGGLWKVIHGTFTLNPTEIMSGFETIGKTIYESGTRLAKAFKSGWDDGVKDFASGSKVGGAGLVPTTGNGKPTHESHKEEVAPAAKTKGSGHKSVTINVHINNLIGSYNSSVTNVKELGADVRGQVVAALMSAVNDFQIVADN